MTGLMLLLTALLITSVTEMEYDTHDRVRKVKALKVFELEMGLRSEWNNGPESSHGKRVSVTRRTSERRSPTRRRLVIMRPD